MLVAPTAASAEVCCDKTTTNACSGSGFSQVVDTNQSMPNCGCGGATPNYIGCVNKGGGVSVICCMQNAPSGPETSGQLYVCKQVGTGKVLDCATSTGTACTGPAAQAACGFPANPEKCIEEVSSAKSCDEAKNPSAPKEAAAPPKKAAPIPALANPLGTTNISEILGRVVSAFLGIAGSVALLMFVYGGFTWITSGGSSERITKGKNTMIWAVIGIAFIFSSYAILSYLLRVFAK
jgi:hypothetical protein